MDRSVPEVDHEAVVALLADQLRVASLRATQLEVLAESLLKQRNAAYDQIEAMEPQDPTNDTTDE